MDVMTTARNIGLIGADGSDVFGTIERDAVLDALGEISVFYEADADLFAAAADRVRASRSGGIERLGSTDFLGRKNTTGEIQLSYRAEMANIFLDLAIDLGLRHSPAPADVV
jgi:hypothetical protein